MLASLMGLFLGAVYEPPRPADDQTRPPYAIESPLVEPRLFLEGVVSGDTDEFGASLTPDGTRVFFSKSVPRSNLYVICVSEFKNGRWNQPEIAPFSGQYWDFDSVVSPNGQQIFFASDRPLPGTADGDRDFDIWVVDRTRAGWSAPRNVGAPVNSTANEAFASVTRDGTLYFTSNRYDGRYEIYRSRLVNGRYTNPEKLTRPLNAPQDASLEVVISPDERFLLICPYGRPGGRGSSDIYVSFNRNGSWTSPINLGVHVNTRAREYSPRISPDGRYLIFTSERGFATNALKARLTFQELQAGLRGTLNGWGNIYQIDLEPLKQEALEKLDRK